MKFHRQLIAIALVIACMATVPAPVQADTLSQLQQQQADLKDKKADTQDKLSDAKAQEAAVEQQMQDIDEQLSQASAELITVQDQLADTDLKIADLESQIADIESQRDEQYETLKTRLRTMYMNGTVGYLDVIFDADNFTDLINRVEYINRIAQYDKDLVSELQATEDKLNEKDAELDKQRSAYEDLVNEKSDKQQALADKMEQKQELYNSLASDTQTYQAELDSIADTEAQLEKDIQAKEKELAQQSVSSVAGGYASATINQGPYEGQFEWPVDGYYRISDVYRNRLNPVNGKAEHHNGVDIPAPTGTNIMAADAGVVITAGWKSGYGNCVIIDHGNGYSTLYGHNSKLVAYVGEYVQQGQVIAKAGMTGNATGPHCHFEVRINGKPVNPQPYLNY